MSVMSVLASDKTVPDTFQLVKDRYGWVEGTVNYDYGCGIWPELLTNKLAEHGVRNFYWDPFHDNDSDTKPVDCSRPNTITCNNVLNVLNLSEISEALSIIKNMMGPNTVAYFLIYEGDKSNMPQLTSRGYQRNLQAERYEAVFKDSFKSVVRTGNLFMCKAV